jgi:hypothetical protein
MMRRLRAGLALALVGSLTLGPVSAAGGPGLLAGTAEKKAEKPYTDYTVRARDVSAGTIASTTVLDSSAKFSLGSLVLANYLVELVDKGGKVVCTEGPFQLSQAAAQKTNVNIDCGVPPAGWLLVAAAAAAGLTAGIVAGGENATNATPTGLSVSPTSGGTASASR